MITLCRDGNSPLKFNGERIGDATRDIDREDEQSQEMKSYVISSRLYRSSSGKYVLGAEIYNQTDEKYLARDAWKADSLEELAEKVTSDSECQRSGVANWLDKDILAELFKDTEIGDQFVEFVD